MDQNNGINNNITAAQAGDREIVISRVFDASRELVFDAWTKEEHLAKWWGPQGFTSTFQTLDLKPGGTWILLCTVLKALIFQTSMYLLSF